MSHEQGDCTPVKEKIKRFTQETRTILEHLLRQKRPKTEIASIIQISVRSINREIKANSYRHEDELGKVTYEYRADIAEQKHTLKMQAVGRKCILEHRADWRMCIEESFRSQPISPYHLAVRMKKLLAKGYAVPDVSSSTLYYAINHGKISTSLKDLPCRGRMRRRSRCSSPPPRLNSRNTRGGLSIEQRPAAVNDRREFGHWEMDTVRGKASTPGCFLVLTERMTRLEHILFMPHGTQQEVRFSINKLERHYGLAKFRVCFKSITCDNGCEFLNGRAISLSRNGRSKRTQDYYAHPNNPQERGSNENQNRLIRRFFPKGVEIKDVPPTLVDRIANFMNKMPRKLFAGRCAYEMARLCGLILDFHAGKINLTA